MFGFKLPPFMHSPSSRSSFVEDTLPTMLPVFLRTVWLPAVPSRGGAVQVLQPCVRHGRRTVKGMCVHMRFHNRASRETRRELRLGQKGWSAATGMRRSNRLWRAWLVQSPHLVQMHRSAKTAAARRNPTIGHQTFVTNRLASHG